MLSLPGKSYIQESENAFKNTYLFWQEYSGISEGQFGGESLEVVELRRRITELCKKKRKNPNQIVRKPMGEI